MELPFAPPDYVETNDPSNFVRKTMISSKIHTISPKANDENSGNRAFAENNETVTNGFTKKFFPNKMHENVHYATEQQECISPSNSTDVSYNFNSESSNVGHSRLVSRGRIEEPGGYWVLPRTRHHNSRETSCSTTAGHYITPGGRYLNRTPRLHTAGVQFSGVEKTLHLAQNENIFSEDDQLTKTFSSMERISVSPRMSVTFVYNPIHNLRTAFGDELIVKLQAQCRTYLAKRDKRRRLREDDAVRCIQRNAASYFDPWVRLILALRPHLKRHKLEDEINQVKSELERYKAMVKVLRFENVAYQDKITRLLQLLDQMHPEGVSSDLVSKLFKELTMAVGDHQRQWKTMISGLPPSVSGGSTALVGDENSDGVSRNALLDGTYQQARENAEFYRNQLEMLREEVDDQNARTSQHYEEKIGILTERVENLQNLLTQEGGRSERLNAELEIANTMLGESRLNEEKLENLILEMKKELKKRLPSSIGENAQPYTDADDLVIETKDAGKAYATAPGPHLSVDQLDEKSAYPFNAAQIQLENIRQYLMQNGDIYEALKDTPLGNGGDFDLLADKSQIFASGMLTPDAGNVFFRGNSANFPSQGLYSNLGYGTPPTQSMNSVYNSRSHFETYNTMKQSDDSDLRISELQQQLEKETGYREDVELEAQEMRNRIANLTRQLRRQRDEHEEEILQKDQWNQRKTRELEETVEELAKENKDMENRYNDLQKRMDELRQEPTLSDEEDENIDLHQIHSRLTAENRRYLKEIECLREEFEQYKSENNKEELAKQLSEKDEKISQLEVIQQHSRSDIEILNVRLNNANSLLDESEQRGRVMTKERQNLVHRISQLESERDQAVREAASAAARGGAERENASARQRELETIREERNSLLRDMMDVKVSLTESSTKAQAEKIALEKRLADVENLLAKREHDLKSEVERYRENIENLQQEFSELQKIESATSTDNRHLKRQVNELQANVDNYMNKISTLERRSTELHAELERAKTSLMNARETVNLLRDRQSRANEEFPPSAHDDMQISDDDDNINISTYELNRMALPDMFNSIQTLDRPRKNRQRTTVRVHPFASTRSLSRSNKAPAQRLSKRQENPSNENVDSSLYSLPIRRKKVVSENIDDSDLETHPTD